MARKPTTDEAVWALGYAQPAIQAKFGANACIVATRVAVEVLRHHGVRVEPLAVQVDIYNPAYVENVERGKSADAIASDPDCWSAQLGFTAQPQADGELDMHVVAVVERRLLLDLTLDQCSAPEHDVRLTPGVFYGLPPGFERSGTVSYPVNGCAVAYEAHPEEKAYLTAPDWTDRARRQPFVEATLERLRLAR